MQGKVATAILSACVGSIAPLAMTSADEIFYLSTGERSHAQNIDNISNYIDVTLASMQKAANSDIKKIQAFRTRLNEYRNLSDGWDGGDGIAPSSDSLSDLEALFDLVVNGGYPIPDPSISSEGEVGLYWRKNSIYINLEFDEGGLYSFYGQNAKGAVKFLDNLPLSAGLASDVIAFINLLHVDVEPKAIAKNSIAPENLMHSGEIFFDDLEDHISSYLSQNEVVVDYHDQIETS